MYAGALAGGVALSMPFLPALPWLGVILPVFLVPVCRLAARVIDDGASWRRAWLLGYTFGVAFVFSLMIWIPRLAPDYLVVRWIMWPSLVALSLYFGAFPAFSLAIAVLVARRSRVPLTFLLAATWSVSEWVMSRGVLGFTWPAVGYGWWGIPLFFQTLDLYGLFGLTFVTFVIAGLLATRRARPLAGAGILYAGLIGYGAFRLHEPPPGDAALDVALIQPNLGVSEKWAPENRQALFLRYLHQSREAVGDHADLLVWPETATPFLLLYAPPCLERLGEFVRATRTPLLTGTPHVIFDGPQEVHYNAAVLFSPDRPDTLVYYKRQLVPFSEWLPWNVLRVMGVDFGQGSFTPGRSADPLPVDGHAAGMLICIEAAFPHLARSTVRAGADFLVNITNDVWFGESPAPHEHANMSLYRAVELRRPLVRCANTGVSMLVDRTGRATQSLGTFKEGVIRGRIHPETDLTFYARAGDWILGLAFLTVGLGIVLPRKRRPIHT